MTLILDDPRHGTVGGYKYHKCRCRPCRGAYAIAAKHYRDTASKEKKRARAQAYRNRGAGFPENLLPIPGIPPDLSEMIPSCDGYNHYQTDYDA